MRRLAVIPLLAALVLSSFAQSKAKTAAKTQAHFLPLDQWRIALASGNMKRFADFYSSDPPVLVVHSKDNTTTGPGSEVEFWNQVRQSGLKQVKADIFSTKNTPEGKVTSVHVKFQTDTPNGPRTRYVLYNLLWQKQGQAWRIIKAAHSGVLKMDQPSKLNPHLYNVKANAKKEIAETIAAAKKDHKRIILVFGGNWCYDCHVLDYCFHQPDVEPLVDKNYHVVHVDIGAEERKNTDLVEKYKIPIEKGVPALAVLDSDGSLLYSQQNGEFESARSMDPDDVIAFLNKWKPEKQ
ncbi:MAG: thioredoxin family protein [Acidobacteriaceae bacterium]